MEEIKREKVASTEPQRVDVHSLVKQAVEEYTRAQQAKAEPAYRAELQEERKRREQLERRVNDLIEENKLFARYPGAAPIEKGRCDAGLEQQVFHARRT